MSRIRILLCATLACSALAGGAIGAGQAQASASQKLYFEGSTDLLNPTTRPATLAQLKTLGVKALRVELNWTRSRPTPPARRSRTSKRKTPTATRGASTTLLAEAQKLGWQVLLTVTAPAPSWATAITKLPTPTRPDDSTSRNS